MIMADSEPELEPEPEADSASGGDAVPAAAAAPEPLASEATAAYEATAADFSVGQLVVLAPHAPLVPRTRALRELGHGGSHGVGRVVEVDPARLVQPKLRPFSVAVAPLVADSDPAADPRCEHCGAQLVRTARDRRDWVSAAGGGDGGGSRAPPRTITGYRSASER